MIDVSTMKRKCKVLEEYFTDEELQAFLDETQNNLSGAIYEALQSAYTIAENARSRGGVSETYALNWEKLLALWRAKAVEQGYDKLPKEVFVATRV